MATDPKTEEPTNPTKVKAIPVVEEGEAADAEKHLHDDDMVSWAAPGLWFGGAQSFAEIDAFIEASDAEQHVNTLTDQLETVVRSIFNDPDMSMVQKAAAVKSAVGEFEERIDDPETTKDKDKEEEPSLLRRVMNFGRKPAAEKRITKMVRGVSAPGGSFSLKEIDGELWWIGIYSNAFEDKDFETLSEAAHLEFIDHCEKSGQWPVLELWHTPGTEFGRTKQIGYADRFTVAMGTINEGSEDLARRLETAGPLAMSHGFAFDSNDRDQDGVFKRYRTHEISVLPAGMAANDLTGWSLNTEEMIQMFEGPQRDFFVKVLGEDKTTEMEQSLAKAGAAAEADGVAFKDFKFSFDDPPKEDGTGASKVDGSGMEDMIKGVNDGFEAIQKAIEATAEEVKAMRGGLDAQAAAIAELQEVEGDKMADRIRPIRFLGAKAASDDDDTILDGRKKEGQVIKEAKAAESATGFHPDDPLGSYLADVGIKPTEAGYEEAAS